MKNAIILHGLADKDEYYDPTQPSASNAHWFPWLQKQLLMKEIKTDTPEVPRPFDFDYEAWVREVERFSMTPDTALIGHSMGGGFWLRYLSEHPKLLVAKVILVAPWFNVDHEENTTFFDFTLRPDIINQAKQFTVFASDNDLHHVQRSVAVLRQRLPSVPCHMFHNYGHFCFDDMGTVEFSELLEAVLPYDQHAASVTDAAI